MLARACAVSPFCTGSDDLTNVTTLSFLSSARGYHIDEISKSETLEIDIDYYLKNQIHPVVGRMMEPIEGTDNAQIADCLGLDPAAFRREYTMQVRDTNESFQRRREKGQQGTAAKMEESTLV